MVPKGMTRWFQKERLCGSKFQVQVISSSEAIALPFLASNASKGADFGEARGDDDIWGLSGNYCQGGVYENVGG